jgi:phosphoenolpyruvate carboxykinase (ATP)
MAFIETLKAIEKNAQIEPNPSWERLRELSKGEGRETALGSMVYGTKIKGRSAKLTTVVEGEPTPEQKELLKKVAEYAKGKKLIQMDRKMCLTGPLHCRAYVSEAYAHIPYMWGKTLFEPEEGSTPDFTSIQIPEWQEIKVLADAKSAITFILGSDYMGEMKKSNLRMAMYDAKKKGGLGLHAGSKLLKARQKDGSIAEKGVLLFGLSATGKTTLTCHHHWLDESVGEGVTIRQDDVVLMRGDSSCIGTENNFYIKTDGLEEKYQPLLYKAALSKNALMENVTVLEDGKLDFFDSTLTTNGRAVVLRSEIGYTNTQIDLPRADMMLFITRRNTIVPPIAKLTRAQGAAFFMLGESVGSAASDVDPGKPRRVVGTNPFIIGSFDEEGNRFYELLNKNPHIECYLLNTAMIGFGGKTKGQNISVFDSATMIKEIARGNVTWKGDSDWGYQVPDEVPGLDMSKFRPRDHYTKEKYAELTDELKGERKEWLSRFPSLHPDIKNAVI